MCFDNMAREKTFLTLTSPTDAVEDVAGLTLAAVRAQQVDTTVTLANRLCALTLIDIYGRKRGHARDETMIY